MNYHTSINDLPLKYTILNSIQKMQQFIQQSQILHLEHQVSALVTQHVFPSWLLNNKCSISPVFKAGTKYNRTERRHHTIWAQTKYTG